MQKPPVPPPTLPVATESKPPVPLPSPPVLSPIKLAHMKEALCLLLLDEELTRKKDFLAGRLTHLSVE
jgi:hypothetical protein